MKLTLAPRKAASTLERVVVWLTPEDIDSLLWDGDLEKTFREGGPTVRVTVDTTNDE